MVVEKKFYLTAEGLKKIKKEYKVLKNLMIAKTKGEVPKIWESEDLNPEYLSFREDLNFIEIRMAEVENILKNAKLIRSSPKKGAKVVDLGTTVSVEVEGNTDEFKIVGTLEANPVLGRISNESPVGGALLSHKVGDEVVVSSPIKTIYKIKKIKY